MLQGQVVLVTGAAQGIGRYIARRFAQVGAKLVVSDVKPLDGTVAELRELGVDILAIKADVRDESAVKAMVERAASHFGRLDVLVNNAGLVTHFAWEPRWPRIRDMDKDFWSKILDTNLGGTYLCTKHALPYMEPRRAGHIINLYGGTATAMGIGACLYAVSKEAIRMFTRHVAEEEREWNICVVAIAPGAAIATEDATEEARRRLPGPELVDNAFLLAAELGMEETGRLFQLKEGRLQVIE